MSGQPVLQSRFEPGTYQQHSIFSKQQESLTHILEMEVFSQAAQYRLAGHMLPMCCQLDCPDLGNLLICINVKNIMLQDSLKTFPNYSTAMDFCAVIYGTHLLWLRQIAKLRCIQNCTKIIYMWCSWKVICHST
jgi:hypothetical protein